MKAFGDITSEIQTLRDVVNTLTAQHTRDLAEIARLDGEVIRARAEVERMRRAINTARGAAAALVSHIDDLGAFVDDDDPRAMALAGPIGAAQADLWAALGLDLDAEAERLHADIENRCAVCGWTLATSAEAGCIRGNCSMRPRPERLYAPERAARETLAAEKGKDRE